MSIKTSAIKDYNAAVVKQSGRVGTVRYYTKNGLTYVRAASNSSVTNNRTNAQMTQRLMFASLAALYSTLGTHLKGAFPNKAKNQSDFNAFMQVNQGQGVYMTKNQRELGYSVALPVIVASGKLMAITTTVDGSNAISDLQIGSLAPASAKVSELSAAIIANNDGWTYGDQLTIVVLRQDGNYCKPQYVKIVLSRTDETLMSAFGTFSAVSGCLAFGFTGDVCVGFIHSDKDGGMSLSQLVASDGMLTIINSYLTDEVFSEASASYGETKETFLVPAKSSVSSLNGSISSNSSSASTTTKYTLNLAASPTNGGTVTGAGSYAAGTSVEISATPAADYTFSRWSDGDTNATRSVTVNATQTLTAVFTKTSSGGSGTDTDGQLS